MDNIATIFRHTAPAVRRSAQSRIIHCINPELIAGMELEIENTGELRTARRMAAEEVWTVTTDGSLRPRETSAEFVSVPMPLSHLLTELDVFLRNNQFGETNYSDRTSIHVHTNVQDFTPTQLAALTLIYVTVEDILFEFVNYFNSKDGESYYRDTNLYCIPWTQCRMNDEIVRKIVNDPSYTVRSWEKYTALNLVPVRTQGTVEWRHMHGTNDMSKIEKWLNMIGSIMQYARNKTFEDVVKTIETLNDTSAYRQYFNEVIGGVLPYSDEYARKLSDGVLNAKFSLMNKDKKLDKVTTFGLNFDRVVEEAPLPEEEDGFEEIDRRLAVARERIEAERQQQAMRDQRAQMAPPQPAVGGPDVWWFDEPRIVGQQAPQPAPALNEAALGAAVQAMQAERPRVRPARVDQNALNRLRERARRN